MAFLAVLGGLFGALDVTCFVGFVLLLADFAERGVAAAGAGVGGACSARYLRYALSAFFDVVGSPARWKALSGSTPLSRSLKYLASPACALAILLQGVRDGSRVREHRKH